MTTLDTSLATLRSAAGLVSSSYDWFTRWLKSMMPTGLYGRALLIIITPMVVLQSVVAFVFMERHWNSVTQKLSSAVVSDIAALIDVYRGYPQDPQNTQIRPTLACFRPGKSLNGTECSAMDSHNSIQSVKYAPNAVRRAVSPS